MSLFYCLAIQILICSHTDVLVSRENESSFILALSFFPETVRQGMSLLHHTGIFIKFHLDNHINVLAVFILHASFCRQLTDFSCLVYFITRLFLSR